MALVTDVIFGKMKMCMKIRKVQHNYRRQDLE